MKSLLLASSFSLVALAAAGRAQTAEPAAGYVALHQALLDASTDLVVMNVAAHPDDESSRTNAVMRRKYGVRIDTNVEEQSGNRVRLKIDVKEGKRARIRQINIVGNEVFTDDQILDDFELKTPGLLSFYKQDDRYSREGMYFKSRKSEPVL